MCVCVEFGWRSYLALREERLDNNPPLTQESSTHEQQGKGGVKSAVSDVYASVNSDEALVSQVCVNPLFANLEIGDAAREGALSLPAETRNPLWFTP